MGTNYQDVLFRYIDPENVLEYLGGKSKGTLVDDLGPWNDPEMVAEVMRDHEFNVKRAQAVDHTTESDVDYNGPSDAEPGRQCNLSAAYMMFIACVFPASGHLTQHPWLQGSRNQTLQMQNGVHAAPEAHLHHVSTLLSPLHVDAAPWLARVTVHCRQSANHPQAQ